MTRRGSAPRAAAWPAGPRWLTGSSLAGLTGLWLAATLGIGLAAQPSLPQTTEAPTGPRSVLEGVFTDTQAKRGQEIYTSTCAHCHGNALEGGEEAPALVGSGFIADWNGSTVGALVDRTRLSMPDDNPGTLSRQQATDVTVFLLSANHYPVGKAELPPENDRQRLIKIEPIKGSR